MATPKPPTSSQVEALAAMASSPDGRLLRLPGGFWTVRGPSGEVEVARHVEEGRHYAAHDVPAWSTSTLTVRAMEKRGWVARANVHGEEWRDERVITDTGRAVFVNAGI